ncbi:hypothetical protein [Polaribacter gochangensis]|uniref:hypothetical protein n=1 Tax=Polaribacter gochangensis TaxID=3252903 RepID=UPI0039046382
MKYFLCLLFFISSNFSFSQTQEDNYEIYNFAINRQINNFFDKTNSIILIEKYVEKYKQDFSIEKEYTKDSIQDFAMLRVQTSSINNKNFIKKISTEKSLKIALSNLIDNFNNHPSINREKIKVNQVSNINIISSRKFYSFFNKRGKNIDRSWDKIQKKYNSNIVIELSKISYKEKYACFYYSYHCGSLCGSGSLIFMEKKNGKWTFLTELNLWMS